MAKVQLRGTDVARKLTKVVVQRRPDGRLFAGNVEVQHDWRRHLVAKIRGEVYLGPPPRLTDETEELLGISSRCYRLHTCKTCSRDFLGSPSARYCSPECRKPAQMAAAAKQEAQRAEGRREEMARHGFCGCCGKPLRERKRLREVDVRPNYCSNACRQRAYRQRKAGDGAPHPKFVAALEESRARYAKAAMTCKTIAAILRGY
jgi:hypothetical protein